MVADVHDAQTVLGDCYDLVYASVGAINWIPSIARWMRVAACLLRTGGRLYLRDVHPVAIVIDPELRLRYPYGGTLDPVTLNYDTSYVGDGKVSTTSHEWSHGIGEIVRVRSTRFRDHRSARTLLCRLESLPVDGGSGTRPFVLPKHRSACLCSTRSPR